jgi:hypothetical protein
VASANSTTFVRFGSAAVNGTAGNAVQPIIDGAAMQVAVYTVDTTAPVLLSFDLNMRNGSVVLVFSETVVASTVTINEFAVQASATSATPSVACGGALSPAVDSTQITIDHVVCRRAERDQATVCACYFNQHHVLVVDEFVGDRRHGRVCCDRD